MGGCVSIYKNCCLKPSSSDKSDNKRKGKRRRRIKKRIMGRKMVNSDQITNPHSNGSAEEDWFDSDAIFGSDTEDEFQSARYDSMSPRVLNDGSIVSMRDVNHDKHNDSGRPVASNNGQKNQGDSLTGNTTPRSVSKVAKNGQVLDPVSPSTKKKAGLKFPFKWREGHPNSTLLSSKALLHRPIAGSQVSLTPIEEKVFGSWSHTEPSSFKVRSENYLRDKKKEFSSNHAVYEPFGVDVFLCQRKVEHIARYVELPLSTFRGEFPSILVVNVQIPLYSPSIFQSENDGEGMSVALYFRLSESYSKDTAPHFLENLRRVIGNAQEEIKGSTVPVRERLKILGRVANIDDLNLNAAERKLMHSYNGKPFLSRPQHEFYFGENYFEIDLDMHRFSYISRKGFDTFQDRLKHCILDLGLTIQGNKAEELPEQILCCLRLNGIDHTDFKQLELSRVLVDSHKL